MRFAFSLKCLLCCRGVKTHTEGLCNKKNDPRIERSDELTKEDKTERNEDPILFPFGLKRSAEKLENDKLERDGEHFDETAGIFGDFDVDDIGENVGELFEDFDGN